MSLVTRKSRYKEYGFVVHYEYKEESRSIEASPQRDVITTLLRPTTFESSLELIVHTIKMGETAHHLALRYYNDARLWWFIADYNPLLGANDYKEGDQVLIPPNTEVNQY
jgi:hypothetical protein